MFITRRSIISLLVALTAINLGLTIYQVSQGEFPFSCIAMGVTAGSACFLILVRPNNT